MAKSPNNNAVNAFMNQSDQATAAHTQDATVSFGAADPSVVNPITGNLYFGSGNPNTGFLLDTNNNVQDAMKAIHRQGADYAFSDTGPGASGTVNVFAGTQTSPAPNANRAEWNINYAETVGAGGDTTVNLSDYISKFQISETRPGFIHTETFDLLPGTGGVWKSENSNLAFGGDDQTGAAGAQVAENSFNDAFFNNSGYGTIPEMNAAGTQWDFRMSTFAGSSGGPQELAATTLHVLVGSVV